MNQKQNTKQQQEHKTINMVQSFARLTSMGEAIREFY